MGLLVTVDNGGTLTDICAFDGSRLYHTKTLTTPHDLTECLFDGLSSLCEQVLGEVDLQRFIPMIDHLRYSTTQGTNAVVQRKGPRLGILTDDASSLGKIRERAPDLYDAIVGERVAVVSSGPEGEAKIGAFVTGLVAEGANRIVVAFNGADAFGREQAAKAALYRAFPRHLLGAVPLLLSVDLSPSASDERRVWTAILNSFLHAPMETFLYNAERKLRAYRQRNPLLIFRNDGRTNRVARTVAIKTYSSGPRGGVEGAAVLARHYGLEHAVSIDIGGTTTDIAVFKRGVLEFHDAGSIESAPVAIPLARIRSVGVGGSSIISGDSGELQIGPESVGSTPGPASFARGGTAATITDVYAVAGLLDPKTYFGGRLTLDVERAATAVDTNIARPLGLERDVAVKRVIDAYDAKIAEAVRGETAVTADTCLLAFGGGGPMNACGIAAAAGIRKVLIPRYAAVFSAFGIGFSDVAHQYSTRLDAGDALDSGRTKLLDQARRGMASEGFDFGDCLVEGVVAGDSLEEAGNGSWLHLNAVRELPKIRLDPADVTSRQPATSASTRSAFEALPVFTMEDLRPGDFGAGPCLVEEAFFTAYVPHGWRFEATGNCDLFMSANQD